MDKINFDFNEHKGKEECIHCKSQEEADLWCEYMHEHGLTWDDSDSYLEYNVWYVYEENTCYNFNGGSCGDIDWYIERGYTVIEFSSLVNSKKVKL